MRTAASTTHMTDTFDVCLTTMAEANDQYVLGLIVDALYMNKIEISLKPCFSDWLTLLSNISSENIGILNQLDFALSQLIRDESHQQSVISCWTIWCSINAEDIPRDKSVADIFDNTLNELARNSQLLSSVITDWFLDENRKLASAAAGLLSKLWVNGFRNVEFYTLRLDELTHDDLMFLARRMLGFVFAEEHLLSLSLSLLKTNNAKNRTYGIIRSLLAEEVGQDYPYSTIEALEKMKASTVEAELINFLSSIVHTINNRMEALDALPRLNELIPSIHLKREFEKARDKQMQASMEDAQKGSIMRQICTEIPIKAGVGFFSFRDGAYDEPTKMQSISHSVSVPLRHVRDAVGQDIAQLLFRIAKREG